MILKPVFTEKSLKDAKNGKYTFWVDKSKNKSQIKAIIKTFFEVTVTKIATSTLKGSKKRSLRGIVQTIPARKKATVELKAGDKITIFEEEKKAAKKKTSK